MFAIVEDGISEENKYTFEEAVALIKIGKFHYWHLLVCGMCITAMLAEVGCLSLLMFAAKCDLQFSVTEQSILGSSGFIGVVLGSQVLGTLADIKGRRKTLLISIALSICASVISSFSVHTYMLIAFRMLNGFFISGGQSVMFSYLGEFHSDRTRAKYITLVATFLPLGSIYYPGNDV